MPTPATMPDLAALAELLQSLAGHEGEIDLHLDNLSVYLPHRGDGVRLDGTVAIRMRVRALSDAEKHELDPRPRSPA